MYDLGGQPRKRKRDTAHKTQRYVPKFMQVAASLASGKHVDKIMQTWKDDPSTFWRDVLQYSRLQDISFRFLIRFLVNLTQDKIRTQNYRGQNYTKIIMEELFTNRGTTNDFCDGLALVKKTSDIDAIINYIRDRLKLAGVKENIIPSNRSTRNSVQATKIYFIELCKPEPTTAGFRIDLVATVKLVLYLHTKSTDLKDAVVDIWGDGCEIGGKEVTRLCFRLLSLSDRLSVQSSDSAFCFASYYGKDTRFGLEENLGWTTAGDQTTGWLYRQTEALNAQGALVTYSGDSPFILRLFTGKANDKVCKSSLPLYIDPEEGSNFLPNQVDQQTLKRLDVPVPFRKDIPRMALAYARGVTVICPDATHMMIRLVECDLKKMAQLIIDVKKPYWEHAIQMFELRLTDREVDEAFAFNIQKKDDIPTVQSVSLSGAEARSAIADVADFSHADRNIGPLYEDVWTHEPYPKKKCSSSITVLKNLGYDHLFNEDGEILYYDLAELLRRSLNESIRHLRDQHQFDKNAFSRAAETYYQVSLMLFGDNESYGLTPYKLKLMLIPQLLDAGHIQLPYNHLTEATEKSNHHAHKLYSTKTMRGGGLLRHEDPVFLDIYFSFCNVTQRTVESDLSCCMRDAHRIIHGNETDFMNTPTYQDICKRNIPMIQLNIGTSTEFPLAGMKFLFLGRFAKTKQTDLEDKVEALGGTYFEKSQAIRVMKSHSSTPHCYVVLPNDKELKAGISKTIPSDSGQTNRDPISRNALTCRLFAGGNFKFLDVKYIYHVEKCGSVQDPTKYLFSLVNSHAPKHIFKGRRNLFKGQRDQCTNQSRSAIASIKKSNKEKQEQRKRDLETANNV